RRIDLQGKAGVVCPGNGLHGPAEGTWDAAERVVELGPREIEAERHLVETRSRKLLDELARQGLGGGGNRGRAQPVLLAARDEPEQVGAGQGGPPAGDDERGPPRRRPRAPAPRLPRPPPSRGAPGARPA